MQISRLVTGVVKPKAPSQCLVSRVSRLDDPNPPFPSYVVQINTINMKKLLLISSAVFFSFCAQAQIKQQQFDTSNLPDGPFVAYYENGQTQVEGAILNGKWEGKNTYYYQDGKVESIGFYHNGLPEGPWESYYDSGTPEKKGTYVDGKWNGRYLWYTREGRITEKIYEAGEIVRGERVVSDR